MSAAARDYVCPATSKRRSAHRFAGLFRTAAKSADIWRRPKDAVRGSFHPAGFAPTSGTMADGAVDFSAEARSALARVTAFMPGVRLQFAAEPGLSTRIDQRALGQLLDLLLRTAAEAAPSGRILLGGMSEAGFLRIIVLDEGINSGRDQVMRQAAALAAHHGGSLEVETAAEEGTAAVLRLPAA